MAITVDYTPYGAVYDLAQQAGRAEGAKIAAQQQMQREHMQMQAALQRSNQEFQARMQQQATEEQFARQMQLLEAKKQIDMDMEIQQYAMDKQKLNSTLSLIRDSGYSDEEKERLMIQARAKYAGVGQGITDDLMGAGGMGDFMGKAAMRMQMAQGVQTAVDQGQIGPEQANLMLASFGIPHDIQDPQVAMQEKLKDAADRVKRAREELQKSFRAKDEWFGTGVRPLDPEGRAGSEIKEDSPEWAHYQLLKDNLESAKAELQRLLETGSQPEVPDTREQFVADLGASPSMQQAVELYGQQAVFDEWLKSQKRRPTQKPGAQQEKKEGYPWWGYHPAGAAYKLGQRLRGK